MVPLKAETTKCNFDVTLLQQDPIVGFGYLLCDRTRKLLMEKNGPLEGPNDVMIAEALRCREALSWLK